MKAKLVKITYDGIDISTNRKINLDESQEIYLNTQDYVCAKLPEIIMPPIEISSSFQVVGNIFPLRAWMASHDRDANTIQVTMPARFWFLPTWTHTAPVLDVEFHKTIQSARVQVSPVGEWSKTENGSRLARLFRWVYRLFGGEIFDPLASLESASCQNRP